MAFKWWTISENPQFRLQLAYFHDPPGVFSSTNLYLQSYPTHKKGKDIGKIPREPSPYLSRFFHPTGTNNQKIKQTQVLKVPWEELQPNASITISNKMFTTYYQIVHYQQTGLFPKNLLRPLCFTDIRWPQIRIDKGVLLNRDQKIKNGDRIDPDNPRYKALDFAKETQPEGPSSEMEKCLVDPDDPNCPSADDTLPIQLRRLPNIRMIPYMPLIMLDEHILPTVTYGKYYTIPKNSIQTPLLIYVTSISECVIEAGTEYFKNNIGKTAPIDWSTYRKDLRQFLKLTQMSYEETPDREYNEDEYEMLDFSSESHDKLTNIMKMVKCNIEGHVVNYNTRVKFTLAGQTLQKFGQCIMESTEYKTVDDFMPKDRQ
jgi:hypothetical protein